MNVRIADAVNNSGEYIAQLSAMEDAELQRKLRIVREQMQLAFQQNKSDSFKLLQLWEEQIITARYIRNQEDRRLSKPKKKVVSPPPHFVQPVSQKELEQETHSNETGEPVSSINQLVLF